MTRAGLVLRGVAVALSCATGVALAAASGALPERPAGAALPPGAFAGALLPPRTMSPDFTLRDERGRPVSSRDLRGRPAVVAFATAACEDVCTLTLQTVRGALDDVRANVPALAIAVDPPRDTPERARRFLNQQRVAGRIRFALGTHAQLAPVWRGFGVQPETVRVHHQARIVLLDRRGRQRVGYFAQSTTPEEVAHDLRLLLRGQDS